MTNRKLIILLILILVIAAITGALLWFLHPAGECVVVTVQGTEYGTYALHENRIVRIAAEDGSWYNLLRIENGTASVIEADCDNQICVHTPPLSGDTIGVIVCLPHGVAIELK